MVITPIQVSNYLILVNVSNEYLQGEDLKMLARRPNIEWMKTILISQPEKATRVPYRSSVVT